ncbi:PTS transporter subunit EIIB [Mycoplasmopsis arginini]|uniref:PTS transporter subunit EIIB n=1 Tax=Mycoplasmopsis arginini TaxID=2094 RepID=A0ABZ2AIV5_MYCAR|nr:PTS transporter subunit EIIB [Mycoplasmopsis arginini]WVN22051.1 PTS transporter subunit EIIB [Mycoplasmopsis arginini]BAQ54634.1 hypothetical protein MARG145_0713 [Mycoplasmopsis arginini]VEU81454.1 PTS system IIB component [Mycoplasmopsis arginini]
MNSRNKFLYVILIILTFGLILVYWKNKYKQTKTKDYLSKETKLNFNFDELVDYLGGKENIESVTSTQKVVKINFYEKNKVDALNIKNLDGVTGLTFQSKSISLVVGNTAKHIEELINEVK